MRHEKDKPDRTSSSGRRMTLEMSIHVKLMSQDSCGEKMTLQCSFTWKIEKTKSLSLSLMMSFCPLILRDVVVIAVKRHSWHDSFIREGATSVFSFFSYCSNSLTAQRVTRTQHKRSLFSHIWVKRRSFFAAEAQEATNLSRKWQEKSRKKDWREEEDTK